MQLREINEKLNNLKSLNQQASDLYNQYDKLSKESVEIEKQLTQYLIDNKLYLPIEKLKDYIGKPFKRITYIYQDKEKPNKIFADRAYYGSISDDSIIFTKDIIQYLKSDNVFYNVIGFYDVLKSAKSYEFYEETTFENILRSENEN